MRLIDLFAFTFTYTFTFIHVTHAFSIPFEVWTGPSKAEVKPHHLHRRDAISLRNIANSVYVGNVTLSIRTVPVLSDTGRYALLPIAYPGSWLVTPLPFCCY